MATSTETKIIEIKVASGDALQRIVVVGKEITNLNNSIDELNQSYKDGKIDAEAYTRQKTILTSAVKAHRQEVNTLSREIVNNVKVTKEKLGYIQRLEAEVSNLTLKYKQLSQSELEGAKGDKTLTTLKSKRDELARLNQAYGNYTHDVGNYAKGTNQLSIMMGQVMKEAPNFAISARIGIMSLSNNLVPLAEAIKAVKVQNAELVAQGKATQSLWKTIGSSIFGLTGILSMVVVLFQLFGEDMIKWVGTLFKAKNAVDELKISLEELNKTATDKLVSNMDKARLFAIDYNKAVREGNIDRIKQLTEVGKKEFGLHEDRLKKIGENVNAWRDAFKEYLKIAKDTYWNEALSKMKTEELLAAEISANKMKSIRAELSPLEERRNTGQGVSIAEAWKIHQLRVQYEDEQKLLVQHNDKIRNLNKIAFRDVYSNTTQEIKVKKDKNENQKKDSKEVFDYEKKLRDASAKGEKDDLYQKVELARATYLEQQAELDKAYKKKLVSQAEYEKLSIAYQTQFTTKVADIYTAEADKELKIIEEKGKKEIELTRKHAKEKQSAIIEGLRAEIDVLDMKSNTSSLNNNGAIDIDAEKKLLDKKKELDKTQRYLELEEKGASAVQLGEAMAAIDDYYLALSVQKERDAFKQKADIAKEYAQSAANILDGIFSYTNAVEDAELQLWSEQNKGKANYDEEYAAKKAKIDHDQAVRNKAMQVINATINGAAAVVALLATPPLAIAAGIAAALQIATIIATPIPSATATSSSSSTSSSTTATKDLTSKMASPLSSSVSSIQSTGGSNAITSGAANVSTASTFNYDALANAMSKQPAPELSLVELKRAQKQVDFIDNASTIKG